MVKFILPFAITFLFFISCNNILESGNRIQFTPAQQKSSDTSTYNKYSWLKNYNPKDNITNRIPVPDGYKRITAGKGSFADWLRHLPLKEADASVKLYNGSLKFRQDVHFAVINVDPGNEDLQQCADACMRLKAEYHYSKKEYSKIHFKFTSGHTASWDRWRQGHRPVINGNKVTEVKKSSADDSYKNFKSYLKSVFMFAGTSSLSKECKDIVKEEIRPGDIFIMGGFPGHAVIVVDVAENTTTKEKIFLIAQSYMPAQEIHILKNFNEDKFSPWYGKFADALETPEWTFQGRCLKRFP